jgi:hypothetical protein
MTSPLAVDIEQLLNLCGHHPDGSFRRDMIDSYVARGPMLMALLNNAAVDAEFMAMVTTLAADFAESLEVLRAYKARGTA